MNPMELLIRRGRLLDPASGRDGIFDILIDDGVVRRIAKTISRRKSRVIDARGTFVFPGLVDMHCHLREPGREDEETVVSGSRAAVAGGFTTVCCMPNTCPALDSRVAIRFVSDRARSASCEVLPIGCITMNREGKSLAPYGEMIEAGAVGFSDDGRCVMDSLVMRRALAYTKIFGKPVISHAEDETLSRNGVMNEGALSAKLGLQGIPCQAEEIMVARDCALAGLTGGVIHIAHVTTAGSVDIVRKAKKKNPRVTCEVTPHHLVMTEDAVTGYDTRAKVSPPLRTRRDVDALVRGVKDGTIDCIVTDHAPHAEEEKEAGFDHAPFGMIGLETALPLVMTLRERGVSMESIVSALTVRPAGILGIERGSVSAGKRADLVIFDPAREWTYRARDVRSKSANSPFIGRPLTGKVVMTVYRGAIVFQDESFP